MRFVFNFLVHNDKLETIFNNIIDYCIISSDLYLPKIRHSNVKQKHYLCGWKEYVEPHRQVSIMWHDIWLQNGSARNGILSDIMRKTRAKYHYSIKCLRSNQKRLQCNKIAQNLADGNQVNFWSEVKRMKGCNSISVCFL